MKKMKRFWKTIILCFFSVLVGSMSGCNNEKKQESIENTKYAVSKIGEKLQEDEILLVSENIDAHFCANVAGVNSLNLECISKNKIDEKELEVQIDEIATPYQIVVDEVKDEKLDVFLYAQYAGADFIALQKRMNKDVKEYDEEMKKYKDDLQVQEIPALYHYVIGIKFKYLHTDEDFMTESFEQVSVVYKEKKYDKKIGKVVLDYEHHSTDCENVEIETIAANDILITKNKQGKMNVALTELFKCKEEISLESVELLEDYVKIAECEVQVLRDGQYMNFKFGKEPVKLKKGDEIGFDITLENENLKDKFYGQNSCYIVMNYTVKGKQQQAETQACFKSKYTAYELYAYYCDKLNLDQYLKFINQN